MIAAEFIFGIVVFVLVLGLPAVLMILLIYFGEKSRRAERTSSRFHGRGFEVKQAAGETAALKEKEK